MHSSDWVNRCMFVNVMVPVGNQLLSCALDHWLTNTFQLHLMTLWQCSILMVHTEGCYRGGGGFSCWCLSMTLNSIIHSLWRNPHIGFWKSIRPLLAVRWQTVNLMFLMISDPSHCLRPQLQGCIKKGLQVNTQPYVSNQRKDDRLYMRWCKFTPLELLCPQWL